MTEEPRYIRFWKPPRGRYSRNHLTGQLLRGVSCYRGVLSSPNLFTINTSEISSGRAGTLLLFAALDSPAFFLSGEEVGVGTDGEPLLRLERSWPVPREVDVTSYAVDTQPALKLWSSGPRNGSGKAAKRLTGDTEYTRNLPNGFVIDSQLQEVLYGSPMRSQKRKRKKRKK